MLAFLVDQAQQLCCALFQAVWAKLGSKRLRWERMRALFYAYALASMRQLFAALLYGFKAISGKEIPVLESACSDEPLGMCNPSPFERSYHVHARRDACLPTVAQFIANRRSTSGGIPAERTATTSL